MSSATSVVTCVILYLFTFTENKGTTSACRQLFTSHVDRIDRIIDVVAVVVIVRLTFVCLSVVRFMSFKYDMILIPMYICYYKIQSHSLGRSLT